MKSSMEMSTQLTRKLLDLKQETVLKLLSMLSSMEPEMRKSEASLVVLREMELGLKSYFSETRHLLDSYEKESQMPLFGGTSKESTIVNLS